MSQQARNNPVTREEAHAALLRAFSNECSTAAKDNPHTPTRAADESIVEALRELVAAIGNLFPHDDLQTRPQVAAALARARAALGEGE